MVQVVILVGAERQGINGNGEYQLMHELHSVVHALEHLAGNAAIDQSQYLEPNVSVPSMDRAPAPQQQVIE